MINSLSHDSASESACIASVVVCDSGILLEVLPDPVPLAGGEGYVEVAGDELDEFFFGEEDSLGFIIGTPKIVADSAV